MSRMSSVRPNASCSTTTPGRGPVATGVARYPRRRWPRASGKSMSGDLATHTPWSAIRRGATLGRAHVGSPGAAPSVAGARLAHLPVHRGGGAVARVVLLRLTELGVLDPGPLEEVRVRRTGHERGHGDTAVLRLDVRLGEREQERLRRVVGRRVRPGHR